MAAKSGSKKLTVAHQIAQLALNSGAQFWMTPEGEAYATITNGGGHRENHLLRSKAVKAWLGNLLFEREGRVTRRSSIDDAILVLEGIAYSEKNVHKVFTRMAEHNGKFYLDLGDDAWQAIEIGPDGWDVISSKEVPVKFRRSKGMSPLPIPRGRSIEDLRAVLNIPEGPLWILIQAWIIQAFKPTGPYPVLIVDGEQGSGKSWLGRILRYVIDPNKAPLRRPPRDERDLWIAAGNSWVLSYDNLSGLPEWLGDGLCTVATGGGGSTRKLYTDNEEELFEHQRPVILNSIEELTARPDLLDRAIIVHLPRIDPTSRMTERDLMRELDRIRSDVLGAILDIVVIGLRELPNVRLSSMPRMADFAEWVAACSPGLSFSFDEFLAAFDANQKDAKGSFIDNDAFATALVEYVHGCLDQQPELVIAPGVLLTKLNELMDNKGKGPDGWPRSPRAAGDKIRRLAPALREVGIYTTELPRTSQGKQIKFDSGCT